MYIFYMYAFSDCALRRRSPWLATANSTVHWCHIPLAQRQPAYVGWLRYDLSQSLPLSLGVPSMYKLALADNCKLN